MTHKRTAAGAAILLATSAFAWPVLAQQAAPAPRDDVTLSPPPGTSRGEVVVVHAGRLLDRPGRPARGPSTLIIRDGRVVQVLDGFVNPFSAAVLAMPAEERPGNSGTLNRNTRVYDLRQEFVLPGLIDSHVHLSSDRAGAEGQLANVTDGVAKGAYEAAWNARKTLDAGFTTVRNLGDTGGVTLALRDAIAAGWAVGPRIVDAGTSISTTAGHMDPTLGYRDDLHDVFDRHDNLCDGPESCRQAVRRQIGRGVDVIKIATTGGVNSVIGAGLGQQMFDDEAKAIIDTAHLAGKKVAVHAHGADGVNLALKHGADSIEHGTLMDAASLAAFKRAGLKGDGAYYVPTLSTVNGYLERIAANPNAYAPAVRAKIDFRIKITGDALRKAVPAGVKIAFGTDAGVSKHGRNADEFELMVRHGMTPATAIQAATVNAADLLGLSAEIGSLEPGKRADLIAVQGDPLQDVAVLKRVGFVMKDGRVHKDERNMTNP